MPSWREGGQEESLTRGFLHHVSELGLYPLGGEGRPLKALNHHGNVVKFASQLDPTNLDMRQPYRQLTQSTK
jgi:hypothetical protein